MSWHRHITAAAAALAAWVCLLVAAAPVLARVPLGSRPLDALRSDAARGCAKRPQPGALALEGWMARHWIGESWGILNCRHVERTIRWSLHAEGRGLDWRLDAAVPAEKSAADRLVARLLASDAQGRPFALARRMGVEEIVFNCRIWQADGVGLTRYGLCRHRPHGRKRKPIDRTIEHLDHVHIGLNWDGAKSRTSFWRYGYDRA
ncbi:MAG: hypothetical protein LC777_15535 [Actinobacteria bacterium]|nr:hypothetical protein [Actinomycetota bacterium]